MALKIGAKFAGKRTWLSQAERTRSKQPDQLDAIWKLYIGNKWIAQLTKFFTHVPQSGCSYGIRKLPRKLSS